MIVVVHVFQEERKKLLLITGNFLLKSHSSSVIVWVRIVLVLKRTVKLSLLID